MGARPYDPSLGRFLAVDPVDGGSANNYDYVGQDPVNGYDLSGTVADYEDGGGEESLAPLAVDKEVNACEDPASAAAALYACQQAGKDYGGGDLPAVQLSFTAAGGIGIEFDVTLKADGSVVISAGPAVGFVAGASINLVPDNSVEGHGKSISNSLTGCLEFVCATLTPGGSSAGNFGVGAGDKLGIWRSATWNFTVWKR